MNVFPITDHADQKFGVILNGQRVTFRLRFIGFMNRWIFDLSIDEQPVLTGRRIVLGIDLLRPFNFGLGVMFAADVKAGSEPDRQSLPNGNVKIFQASNEEVEAAS